MKFAIINRTLLAFALLVVSVSTARAADRFYNTGVYISPGQTGTLIFNLDNDKMYYGFQAEIELPENYEFLTVNGEVDAQLTERASGYNIVSHMVSNRKVIIGAFSTNHEPILGSTGALLYLGVKVLDGFVGGKLTISNTLLTDATDNDVKLPEISVKYAEDNAANIQIEDFNLELGGTRKVSVAYSESGISEFETTIYFPTELILVEGSVIPAATEIERLSDGGWLFRSNSEIKDGNLFDFSVKSIGTTSANCEIELKNQAVTLDDGMKMFLPESQAIVTIDIVKINTIEIGHEALNMKCGETSQLSATCYPENATDKSIVWKSSDSVVATISETGLVTALSLGSTVITAEAADGSGVTAECIVNVIAIPAESVSISPSSAQLPVGESLTLIATVTPEDATDKTVTWTSSDESVATVDASGNVSALKVGTATITAKTTNGMEATCAITVIAKVITAEGLELNLPSTEVVEGESVKLTATITPADATDQTVTWTSSDESVATVDASGNVSALKVGKSTITAKTANGLEATCEITVAAKVIEVDGIKLNLPSAEVVEGESVELTATITPAGATDQTVAWTSSDESVATVDASGNVSALKPGTANITAKTANGLEATCVITVIAKVITAEGLELNLPSAEVVEGESVELTATITPADATDQTVTWTSSDESVATVDAFGNVSALKVGKATITAKTANGLEATCVITVVAKEILAEGIELNLPSTEVVEGESVELIATITPADATDQSVTWTSSDESVATVDASGKVSALKSGKATITAKTANGLEATCVVTVVAKVIEAEDIELNLPSAEVIEGESVELTATVTPADATDQTVTWTSSDESVATVDALGNVSALKVGKATITAKTANGLEASCVVTVVAKVIEITGLELNLPSAEVVEGESVELTATITPADATDQTVTWTSSDESVATVDAFGNVLALKVGKATITAKTANGLEATCVVTVLAKEILAEGIELNLPSAEVIEGESVELTATITPADATDQTVTWTSSDESVATVDAFGNVSALKPGKATITAKTANGLEATCVVTVIAKVITAEGLELNLPSVEVVEGESVKLTATITPADATDQTVTWTSSDVSVATVDAFGNVSALKPGKATITAKTSNGLTATCVVTVVAKVIVAEGLELNLPSAEVIEGESVELTATITPADATDQTVTWTSSDQSVATVDAFGNVSALKPGKATITAKTANGLTATCVVTVVAKVIEAEGIELNLPSAEVVEGESVELTATITPADATDHTVTWTSSDESVATVDAFGNVSALKVGKATITAKTSNGLTATCVVTVVAKVIVAEGLELNLPSAEVIEGESVELTATITPADATDQTVTWTSSDESVASVDAFGNVSALKPGKATITAKTANGLEATCAVTVVAKEILAEGIGLNLPSAEVIEGETVELTATITPADATDQSVTWTSSDVSVATVDAFGNVSALKPGKATITAKTANGLEATCVVTVGAKVILAEGIELNLPEATIKEEETVQLVATVTPADATDQTVTWSSSNEAVATVDQDGLVTALKAGTATITARTANGLTAKCELTVETKTGIDGVEADAQVSVVARDGVITVTAPEGAEVEVYSMTGMRMAKTREHRIEGLAGGVYIVRVAGKSFKVML